MTSPDYSRDYAEPAEQVHLYRRLRGHSWLVDAALALLLFGGSSGGYARQAAVIPVVVVLACAVAVRRRFPVAALTVTVAIGTVQVIAGVSSVALNSPFQPTFADLGILVLVYTVATIRPRQISLAGAAAGVGLFVAFVARLNPGPAITVRPVEFTAVFATYALMPICAWVLGDSMARRRTYLAALTERAVRAEAERDAHAQVAAAAERARIARELHDIIAHNLSVMVAQADGGRYAFDAQPEHSRQALAEIGDTGRQALAEMGHLLGVLKAGEEAPAFAPAPGVGEIGQLVDQAREAGTSVTYVVEGAADPVSAGVSLALYRIVQEALTNIRKHAGRGAIAEVTLRYGLGEISVRVADDGGGGGARVANGLPRFGVGASVRGSVGHSPAGHGLAGMRDRVGLYGGTLEAGPRSDGGFQVAARVPLLAKVSMTGDAA